LKACKHIASILAKVFHLGFEWRHWQTHVRVHRGAQKIVRALGWWIKRRRAGIFRHWVSRVSAQRLSLTCRMVEDLEAQINGLEKSDGQIRERHLREIANWQRRIDDEKALNAQLEDLNQHTWDDRVREIAGSALAENSRPADALFRGSSGPSHVWETPRPLGPGSATRRFMPDDVFRDSLDRFERIESLRNARRPQSNSLSLAVPHLGSASSSVCNSRSPRSTTSISSSSVVSLNNGSNSAVAACAQQNSTSSSSVSCSSPEVELPEAKLHHSSPSWPTAAEILAEMRSSSLLHSRVEQSGAPNSRRGEGGANTVRQHTQIPSAIRTVYY